MFSPKEGRYSEDHPNYSNDRIKDGTASKGPLSSSSDSEELFWNYYLNHLAHREIAKHSTNALLLVLFLFSTSHLQKDGVTLTYLRRDTLRWLCLSFVVMVYLGVFILNPNIIEGIMGMKPFVVWSKMGKYLVLIQFFTLATSCLSIFLNGASCQSTEGLLNVQLNHEVALLQIFLQGCEGWFFLTMPFPFPFAYLFSVIESVSLLLRLSVCFGHLTELGGQVNTWLVAEIYASTLLLHCSVLLSSSRFEYSARKIFGSRLAHIRSADDTFKFINWLCAELKQPLRSVVLPLSRLLDELKPSVSLEEKMLERINRVVESTQLINLIANNLQLLTRIDEGRLDFDRRQLVNLVHLVEKLLGSDCSKRTKDLRDALTFTYSTPIVWANVNGLSAMITNLFECANLILGKPDTDRSEKKETFSSPSSPGTCHSSVADSSRMVLRFDVVQTSDPAALSSHQLVIRLEHPSITASDEALFDGQYSNANAAKVSSRLNLFRQRVQPEPILSKDLASVLSTISLACKALTASYGGRFTIDNGAVECVICCGVEDRSRIRRQSGMVFDTSFQMNSRPTRQSSQKRSCRVCIISRDADIVNAVGDVLFRANVWDYQAIMPGGEGSFSRRLTLEDFSGIDVICVTSPHMCDVIRSTLFAGVIVLFVSGRAYLDTDFVNKYDYAVSIPCKDAEVTTFADFLANPTKRQHSFGSLGEDEADSLHIPNAEGFFHSDSNSFTKNLNASLSQNSLFSIKELKPEEALFSPQAVTTKRENVLLGNAFDFANESSFLLHRFQHQRMEEDYIAWRFLFQMNDDGSNWHYQLHVSILFVVLMRPEFFSSFDEILFIGRIVVLVALYLMIIFRQSIYSRILVPRRIKLTTFLNYSVGFFCFLIFLTVVFLIMDINVDSVQIMIPKLNETLTFEELATAKFGEQSGSYWISKLVTALFLMSITYFLNLPWVPSLLLQFVLFLQMEAILFVVIDRSLSRVTFFSLHMLLLVLWASSLITMYHYERFKRFEFQTLRRSIFQQQYLNRYVFICLAEMGRPLEKILKLRPNFLSLLLLAHTDQIYLLEGATLQGIHVFHKGYLLLHELFQQMKYVEKCNPDGPNTSGCSIIHSLKSPGVTALNIVDVVYLRTELSEIVNGFLDCEDDDLISAFVDVSPELTLILVDGKLLNCVVCQAVRQAVRNIRFSCRQNRRGRNFQHEIIIEARPANNLFYPFHEPRLLMICVYDSGSSDNTDNFGRVIVEGLVRQCPFPNTAFEQNAKSSNIVFGECQKFTLPYKIHSHTHAAKLLGSRLCVGIQNVISVRDSAFYNKQLHPEEAMLGSNDGVVAKTVEALPPRHEKQILFVLRKERDDSELNNLVFTFRKHGWHCNNIYDLRNLPGKYNLKEVDCILIREYDEAQEDCFEKVCHIRLLGFRMIIAGLFNSLNERSRESHYDAVICKPILNSSMDYLVRQCDQRVGQLLLKLYPSQINS